MCMFTCVYVHICTYTYVCVHMCAFILILHYSFVANVGQNSSRKRWKLPADEAASVERETESLLWGFLCGSCPASWVSPVFFSLPSVFQQQQFFDICTFLMWEGRFAALRRWIVLVTTGLCAFPLCVERVAVLLTAEGWCNLLRLINGGCRGRGEGDIVIRERAFYCSQRLTSSADIIKRLFFFLSR